MNKEYDLLVFIGRFQPFHNGHKKVIDRALELANDVLVLVGSSNRGREGRHPFTFAERKFMIESCYYHDEIDYALHVNSINDYTYNDNRWIRQVLDQIESAKEELDLPKDARIGLIGCEKDKSSFYLKLFPTLENVAVDYSDKINATDLRQLYWTYGIYNHWRDTGAQGSTLKESVPIGAFDFLSDFLKTEEYSNLVEEVKFIEQYKISVQKYPRIEHTVDAVVVQSGHILLIRRRSAPGKHKWALPGGFIHQDERLEDSMIRELREETGIKVPEAVLRGSIKNSKCYDDPHRSERGRLITQAFHIALPRDTTLPKVKGMDDADKAKWLPLNELEPTMMFEDHFFIIDDMLGGV